MLRFPKARLNVTTGKGKQGCPMGHQKYYAKLAKRYYGPFQVLKSLNKTAYQLKLPTSWKRKHLVFHESILVPYHPPVFPSQKKPSPPPPIVIDEEEEWEVEEVLDLRVKRGKLEYLVHWKGYTKEDNSWEPSDNLKNSKRVVSDFHKTHPATPRPLDARNILNFIPIENFTEIPKGE